MLEEKSRRPESLIFRQAPPMAGKKRILGPFVNKLSKNGKGGQTLLQWGSPVQSQPEPQLNDSQKSPGSLRPRLSKDPTHPMHSQGRPGLDRGLPPTPSQRRGAGAGAAVAAGPDGLLPVRTQVSRAFPAQERQWTPGGPQAGPGGGRPQGPPTLQLGPRVCGQ